MQPVDGLIASGEFFTVLGVKAALGRTFTVADDVRGGGPDGPVAVISDGLWRRRFGGAPGIIGTPLVVEGVPLTIVGVTPPGFLGLEAGRAFDVAIPLAHRAARPQARVDRHAECVRAVRHAAAEAGSVACRRDRDPARHATGDARLRPHPRPSSRGRSPW